MSHIVSYVLLLLGPAMLPRNGVSAPLHSAATVTEVMGQATISHQYLMSVKLVTLGVLGNTRPVTGRRARCGQLPTRAPAAEGTVGRSAGGLGANALNDTERWPSQQSWRGQGTGAGDIHCSSLRARVAGRRAVVPTGGDAKGRSGWQGELVRADPSHVPPAPFVTGQAPTSRPEENERVCVQSHGDTSF